MAIKTAAISLTWSAAGALATARYAHAATLLPSGHVLAAGSYNYSNGYLASVEQSTIVQASSVTNLVGSNNPSTFGQNVSFTATVTGESPTGKVNFSDGATPICSSVTVNTGSALCQTAMLTVGSHSIIAAYSGDANNAVSSSNTLVQQVNKHATTTFTATNCMTTFIENQPFTLFASVSGAGPSGNVSFTTQANVVLCGNVALNSGSASCTTSVLSVGGSATEQAYSLTANYAGDDGNT